MKLTIGNSTVTLRVESEFYEVQCLFDNRNFITKDVICKHCVKYGHKCLNAPSDSMLHYVCIDCRIVCLEEML